MDINPKRIFLSNKKPHSLQIKTIEEHFHIPHRDKKN